MKNQKTTPVYRADGKLLAMCASARSAKRVRRMFKDYGEMLVKVNKLRDFVSLLSWTSKNLDSKQKEWLDKVATI